MKSKVKSLITAACLSGLIVGTMVAQTQQGKKKTINKTTVRRGRPRTRPPKPAARSLRVKLGTAAEARTVAEANRNRASNRERSFRVTNRGLIWLAQS